MHLTIECPLMPITKSNQGSRPSSTFRFLSTWKPYAVCPVGFCGCSESSREMKRLRAPNMFAMVEEGQG